jgi:ubiquinone/menaquinone biosynthesis C-methylase UbiE
LNWQAAFIVHKERIMVNEEQAKLWNGPAGAAWVEAQESLDRMFKSFEALLVAEVAATGARQVLDVGCGTGATTLAAARQLGARGHCTGVDVSGPMIELARARAAREHSRASVIVADAQTQAFEAAAFDLIISRFGVMFFEDPTQAFANLRRATRKGGQMRCLAFRSAAENPFMTTAERAAAPMLPDLPPRRADGPGQFAFADAQKVNGILSDSGWADIRVERIDVDCAMPEAELAGYLARLGPVGLALKNADDERRARVLAVVRAAFERYVVGNEVRFNAACWMIAARA